MGVTAIFVDENPLPGSETEPAIAYRDRLRSPGERHANVTWHVVRPFHRMRKVRGFLWDQTRKEFFKVDSGRRVRILENNQARACMFDENRGKPVPDSAFPDNLLNP